MNREIEFRGKRKDNNEWIYGCGIYFDGVCSFIINYDVNLIKEETTFIHTQVIPKTVGQYTGLKDKNGKKIFEGDIIKYKTSYIKRMKKGIVLYDDKDIGSYIISKSLKEKDIYCADIFDLLDSKWTCEVIGTIFDKENNNE